MFRVRVISMCHTHYKRRTLFSLLIKRRLLFYNLITSEHRYLWNDVENSGYTSSLLLFQFAAKTSFFCANPPICHWLVAISDSNRIKPHAISCTRSRETKCTLESKSPEPQCTPSHSRLVDDLLCRSPGVTFLFLCKSPHMPPTGANSGFEPAKTARRLV